MIAIDTSPKAEDLEERALEDLRFGWVFWVEADDKPMSFEAAGLNIMHHVDLFMG